MLSGDEYSHWFMKNNFVNLKEEKLKILNIIISQMQARGMNTIIKSNYWVEQETFPIFYCFSTSTVKSHWFLCPAPDILCLYIKPLVCCKYSDLLVMMTFCAS